MSIFSPKLRRLPVLLAHCSRHTLCRSASLYLNSSQRADAARPGVFLLSRAEAARRANCAWLSLLRFDGPGSVSFFS